MNNKRKIISTAVILACSTIMPQANAVLLSNATLNFDAGVKTTTTFTYNGNTYSNTTVTGSYFAMDNNGDGNTTVNEQVVISNNNGLRLGTIQLSSGSHSGAPDGSESPDIDEPWAFFTNTGMHQTTSAIVALTDDLSGNVTLDMQGWSVNWNGIPDIPMGGNDSFPADTGIATLTCGNTCEDGDTFILEYAAHVANTPASGFEGVPYSLYLEGTISSPNATPVANPVSISNEPAATHPWTPSVSDSDLPVQTLTCSIVGTATDGTASVQSDCSTGLYIPAAGAGYSGVDSFTYRVSDGIDNSTEATVSVNITADPVPICPNISATANTGEANAITIDINNCTDNGGTDIIPSSIAVLSPSEKGGTVTVDTSTQVASYTPAPGFSGTDTFTYTVSDSAGTSSPAVVTLTVLVKNSPAVSSGIFSSGTTDTTGDTTDGIVTIDDIGVTDSGSTEEQGIAQSCIGGCFDFVITNITDKAQIVLPLSTPIPAVAEGNSIVYRKLKSTGWVNFSSAGDNAIHSVAGTASNEDIVCPPADDLSYDSNPGLTIGNRCIRLTIVDNGPNDNSVTIGTVADPGGLGEVFPIDTRISGTDGCNMSGKNVDSSQHADWWLLAGFVGLLGLFRLKHNKA